MSDPLRELEKALLDARSDDEICKHLARLLWWNKHGEYCPDVCVPKWRVLVRWWDQDGSQELATKAREALCVVLGNDLAQWLPWPLGTDSPSDARATHPVEVEIRSSSGSVMIPLFLLSDVHQRWVAWPGTRPRHPLAVVVDAWQTRPANLRAATTTITRNGTGMVRRTKIESTVRRIDWEPVPLEDASATGTVVDGEPMAMLRTDPADLFPVQQRRPRRLFKPSEQRLLNLPGAPPIPHDLRLIALQDVDGGPVLKADVLLLLTIAHALDRPMTLHELDGALLLVYDRQGRTRPVQPQYDVLRLWRSARALRTLTYDDPSGSGRWINLATVEVPQVRPVDRLTIGPPAWARPIHSSPGRFLLTAEGSAASRARVLAGKQGLAGRIITGLEYRLAARWDGNDRTRIAPDLRPVWRHGAGPTVESDWRICMFLAGEWWNLNDKQKDDAAYQRFSTAATTLESRGFFVPKEAYRNSAPAGDSVEIVARRRGSRGHKAGLIVRAAARFTEAARLAAKPNGKGLETMHLTDWAGIRLPARSDKG